MRELCNKMRIMCMCVIRPKKDSTSFCLGLLHKRLKYESLFVFCFSRVSGSSSFILSTSCGKLTWPKLITVFSSILFSPLPIQIRNAINCPSYSDIYCSSNTNAGKNLDLAFNKCQQWSNKLTTTTATAVATADEPAAQSRTHKVYDSMKNFLQRKLFAQPSQHRQTEEEPTSDYDEVCKWKNIYN